MRRRYLVSGLIIICMCLCAFVLSWWLTPRPRLDEETFARIQEGMTEAEVIAIMGAPPGDYGRAGGKYWLSSRHFRSKYPFRCASKSWCSLDREYTIYFDDDNRVVSKYMHAIFRRPESSFNRMYWWLHGRDPESLFVTWD